MGLLMISGAGFGCLQLCPEIDNRLHFKVRPCVSCDEIAIPHVHEWQVLHFHQWHSF